MYGIKQISEREREREREGGRKIKTYREKQRSFKRFLVFEGNKGNLRSIIMSISVLIA